MNERKYYTIEIRYSGGDPYYLYVSPAGGGRRPSTTRMKTQTLVDWWPDCVPNGSKKAWALFAEYLSNVPMRGLSLTQVQLVELVPTQTVRYEPVRYEPVPR